MFLIKKARGEAKLDPQGAIVRSASISQLAIDNNDHLNLKDLLTHLVDNISNPDLMDVFSLGQFYLEDGIKNRNSTNIYYSSLLMEWANRRGAALTSKQQRLLAFAHTEAWLSRGVAAESEHLHHAKNLLEECMHSENDKKLSVEYCKVLLYLGEATRGLAVVEALISQSSTKDPALYLLAGAMHSILGQHKEAGECFFESIHCGPPKLFHRSDMMFVLSRSCELMGFESRFSNDDGYSMVFKHMQAEEHSVAPDQVYEDWISDFKTWQAVGDKFFLYGLFSMAADLYGQGLVRDRKSFQKSVLWFRFAKACFRCGRTADAQLACKQAVALDPSNVQCTLALNIWSSYNNTMDEALSGPFAVIMEALPPLKSEKEQAVAKIQAFFRGEESRRCMKYRQLPAEHRDRLKSLRASSGLLLGGHHPVLLSVKPNSAGMIKGLRYFDIAKNTKGWIRFATPFNLPHIIGEYELKLYSSLLVPAEAAEVSTSVHMVAIKYVDEKSGHYFLRQVQLLLDDQDNIRIHMDSIDMRSRTPKLATLPEIQFESFEAGSDVDDALVPEQQTSSASPVVVPTTPITESLPHDESIDKGSYRHAGTLYLYNISDAPSTSGRGYDCKVVDLLLVNSGQKYKYTLPSYMIKDIPVLAMIRRLIMILNVIPTPFDPTDASASNSIVSIGSASLGSGAWSGAMGSYRCGITFCDRYFLVHFVIADDVSIFLIDTQLRPLLIDGDEKKDIIAAKQTEAFDYLYQRAMESFEVGSIVDETKLVPTLEEFDGSSIASDEVLGDQLPEDDMSTARSHGEGVTMVPIHEEAVSPMPEAVAELMRSSEESDAVHEEKLVQDSASKPIDISAEPVVAQVDEAAPLVTQAEVASDTAPLVTQAEVASDTAPQPVLEPVVDPITEPVMAPSSNVEEVHTPEQAEGLSLTAETERKPVTVPVNETSSAMTPVEEVSAEPSTRDIAPEESEHQLVMASINETTSVTTPAEVSSAESAAEPPAAAVEPVPEESPILVAPPPISVRSSGGSVEEKSVKSTRSNRSQNSVHSAKSVESDKKSKGSVKSQKSFTKAATPKTSARSNYSHTSKDKKTPAISDIDKQSHASQDKNTAASPQLHRGDSYVSPTKSEIESANVQPPNRTATPPISTLPLSDILPQDALPTQTDEGDSPDDLSALTPTSLERHTQRSGYDSTEQYSRRTDDDDALNRMESNVTEVYYTGQGDPSPREFNLEHLSPLLGTAIPFSPQPITRDQPIFEAREEKSQEMSEEVSQEVSQDIQKDPSITPRFETEEASGDIFAQEPTESPSKYNNLEFIRAGVKININPANFDSGMWERCNSQQVTHVQSGVKVQAAYFLEVQTRRLEAVEYLCGRANRALYVFDRRDAFNYLKAKAQEVLRIMELEDIVTNASTLCESESRQSDSEQQASIAVETTTKERNVKSKKRPRKILPHHKVREPPQETEAVLTVDDIVRSSTPNNPEELVSTLRALSPSRTRRLEALSSFQESALDTLRTRSRGGLAPLSVDTAHPPRKLSTGSYTNPVDFVANLVNNEAVFERSLADYKKFGYVNGTCRYVQVWKVKLRNCLHLYETPEQLDKAIYMLQRSVPEISKEAAFCALAETEGSTGEAVGKLRDMSFKDEVKLICHALPISQIIRIIGDYKDRNKTQHNLDIMESMQHCDIMRSDTFPDLEPNYTFSPDVSKSLPHLGLDMTNNSVRLRGSVITRKDRTESKSVGNTPLHSPVRNAEQLKLPNIFKSNSDNNSNDPSPKAAAPPPPGVLVKSRSINDFSERREVEKKPMMSKTAATQSSVGGGLDPAFKRIDQLINDLSKEKTSMIVLSRRDALRAEEESLLTRYYGEKSPFRKRRKRREV